MITVSRVAQGDPRWATRVLPFFEAHTDPVGDLLLWADVASNLGKLSTIWLAEQGGQTVGLAFAFPLWPSLSAIGVKGRSPALDAAILAAIEADGVTSGYVICEEGQLPAYQQRGALDGAMREYHMTLDSSSWAPREVPDVRPARLDELDAFYRRCGAMAWNPVQFETGPYFVVEADGQVVAAAGTQFAYDALAQVGNVMTDPAYRGRGYGEHVTAAVTQALALGGVPLVSLFVATDNRAAVRIYERLGYQTRRTLSAFRWSALQQSLSQP